MNDNRGIQQFGGRMQAGVQAVGDHAHAEANDVHVGDGTAVADLLAAVRQLLADHQAELPDAAATTVDILDEELAQPEPSPGAVQRLLSRLTGLVGAVKPVAEAVGKLSVAVTAILGG